MKKKNIYFPIEILYRELNSKLFLTSLLIFKNFRIYLGTKHGIDLLLDYKNKKKIREGIYFNKSVFISNKKYLDKVHKSCEHFVVLDEELGPALASPEFAINNRCLYDKRIKFFFVIGEKIRKKILHFDKRFSTCLKVVGWPKFDFLKRYEINSLRKSSNIIKKKYGEFYLFSSNFGVLSQEGLNQKLNFLKKIKQSKNYLIKKKEFTQNLRDFRTLKKELINANLKYKLIIRPHPSELFHHDWLEIAKKNKNIKIIYEGNSLPWILASKGLIHRGCTTSLDAYYTKKPIFFWHTDRKLKQTEKNLTYKLSYKINKFEKIDKKKIFKSKKNLNKIISKEIKNYNKFNSSKKILNYLDKLNVRKIEEFKIKNEKNLMFTIFKNFIRLIFFSKPQKIPEKFNENHIKNIISELSGKKKFSVKKIHDHLIKIESI